MSIHVFSFEEEYPSQETLLSRLTLSLSGIRLTDSKQLENIAFALFFEQKNVTLMVKHRTVTQIIISTTKSGYDRGSLVTKVE